MDDIEKQTANGKVLWHFTMSLDGFVAGPNHEMDWMMTGISPQPGAIEEYVATTGAILGGSARLGRLPGSRHGLRRRLDRTHLRAHPPSRGRQARRRRHLPGL
ncbi:hypothetical protein ACFSTC_47990 [Nonomuraea ferruginea]